MNKLKKIITSSVIACLSFTTAALPTFASAPTIEEVKYEGSGRVEVEFRHDVDYHKSRVTVKDSSGKSYRVSILDRDDDELVFKIREYKKGKKYSFKITGIRKEHTKSYKTVKGSVSIPKSTSSISRSKAISIAKNHAIKKWNLSSKNFYDVEAERDSYRGKSVYEIDFEKGNYEYEYKIQRSNGKVLLAHREYDD